MVVYYLCTDIVSVVHYGRCVPGRCVLVVSMAGFSSPSLCSCSLIVLLSRYGAPGVEFTGLHKDTAAVTQIQFLPAQVSWGIVISVILNIYVIGKTQEL